ncbi:hypothetical protein GXM_07577 [Nostoc sphaeroides CCNUC1]|uniref:Uncharacterized protein n=1 Tax=Nostoc sphaeroides CCNUC1 TaxID=2653204 RepID=A0A5P8WBC6_9NOSO|nr:hypothetical protein GXM_07577 [Nostoc sphaeroides CCNUC1]
MPISQNQKNHPANMQRLNSFLKLEYFPIIVVGKMISYT